MTCRAVPRRQRPAISRRASARAARAAFKLQSGFFSAVGIDSPSLSFALCARIEGLSYNITTLLNY